VRRDVEESAAGTGAGGEGTAAEGFGIPERWSSAKKAESVLRLLRGEEIGTVSREIQVPAHVVEEWRRVFVESGKSGLRSRGEPEADRDLTRA
jgi:hypothetical protein